MRILHCVLIFAFAILLKNVYYLSSLLKPSLPVVEYYQLAAQWPPGVCSGQSINCISWSQVPYEFKIHGLWPEPNGTRPDTDFIPKELANITDRLNIHWPNLYSTNNSRFWKHEWDHHGRFSEMEELKYFKKTLELFKADAQILKAKLANESITPSSNTYRLQDIEAALKRINGNFSCTVICIQRNDDSNRQQIKEIRFNYTKNFKKQHTSRSSINCRAEILFPVHPGLTEVVSMPEVHHHPL